MWAERRSADPLLPFSLFRDLPFAASSAAAFFSGAAMFGALVHVPLLVQWGRGTDATTAGLALMTMSTGWSVGGLVAGQVLNRLGFRALALAGAALMTLGYAALALRPDVAWIGPPGRRRGDRVGMGLLSITLVVGIQTAIEPARRGVATSGVLFFRNIGATLGVAVMGATSHRRASACGWRASRTGARHLPPGPGARARGGDRLRVLARRRRDGADADRGLLPAGRDPTAPTATAPGEALG